MPRLFEGGNRLDLFAPDAVFLNAAALQACD
jgi:putative ABC transport system permease protein